MNKFKQLASETAIYGLSSIIGKAINFILVPFYTSTAILRIEEYGIVTELYSYVAVLNVLYLYGMETAYFRFTSKPGHGEKEIYSSVFSSVLITTVVLTLLLITSASPIINWLEFAGNERFVYWFAAIIAIDSLMAIPTWWGWCSATSTLFVSARDKDRRGRAHRELPIWKNQRRQVTVGTMKCMI